jgi:hypothetical protein
MTGGFGIDKTGLQVRDRRFFRSLSRFLCRFLSARPNEIRKACNGVEPLLYEYTVIIALIFRDVQSI